MIRAVPATRVAALVGDFDREPAYQGLAEALRVLITDGRLPAGVRLPSERELTALLDVSRTTVTRAYAALREHGYLESRQGSGSIASLPAGRGVRSDHLLPPGDLPEAQFDLTCAAPASGPGVQRAYEAALAELPAYLAGTGYYPSGLPVLREAIAAEYAARGLPTDADQIMVVPGALAGVSIAARTFVARGSRVVMESPSYPNAIATLRHSGARIIGVDLGADLDVAEPDVGELTRTLEQVRPGVAYLIPDFHNPTGLLLGEDGRGRLARTLRRSGTTPIVDESMYRLGLDGYEVPPPLASFAHDAISVGSLSKPFWGGLRVGWIRTPSGAFDALFRARLSLDLGVPLLEQLVAVELLADGERLVQHRRDQLRASRDAGLEALARHLPEWRVRRPAGGLSLWCALPEPLSTALVPHAAAHDVLLAPGPSFAPEGGLDRFVRIPYTLCADQLVAAIARLETAWTETRATPGSIKGSITRSEPPLVA